MVDVLWEQAGDLMGWDSCGQGSPSPKLAFLAGEKLIACEWA